MGKGTQHNKISWLKSLKCTYFLIFKENKTILISCLLIVSNLSIKIFVERIFCRQETGAANAYKTATLVHRKHCPFDG